MSTCTHGLACLRFRRVTFDLQVACFVSSSFSFLFSNRRNFDFVLTCLFVCPTPRPQQRSLTLHRFGILRAYATYSVSTNLDYNLDLFQSVDARPPRGAVDAAPADCVQRRGRA